MHDEGFICHKLNLKEKFKEKRLPSTAKYKQQYFELQMIYVFMKHVVSIFFPILGLGIRNQGEIFHLLKQHSIPYWACE